MAITVIEATVESAKTARKSCVIVKLKRKWCSKAPVTKTTKNVITAEKSIRATYDSYSLEIPLCT
jgi:hypothetical protein